MSVFTAKNKAFDAQNCVFGGRFFAFRSTFCRFRQREMVFHRIGYAPFEAFRANLLFFGPCVKKYSNPKFSRFQWLFFP